MKGHFFWSSLIRFDYNAAYQNRSDRQIKSMAENQAAERKTLIVLVSKSGRFVMYEILLWVKSRA